MAKTMNRRIVKDTFSFEAYKTLAEAASSYIAYYDVKDTKDVFVFIVSAVDNYGRRFWDVIDNQLCNQPRRLDLLLDEYGIPDWWNESDDGKIVYSLSKETGLEFIDADFVKHENREVGEVFNLLKYDGKLWVLEKLEIGNTVYAREYTDASNAIRLRKIESDLRGELIGYALLGK